MRKLAITLAALVSLAIGQSAGVPVPDGANKEKVDANEPAWGEIRDGVRLGLAPRNQFLDSDANQISVTVCYENVSKEEKLLPVHAGCNMYKLMFRGELDGRAAYIGYLVERSATAPPRLVKVAPGKRLHETFHLPFKAEIGTGWHGLPALPAGKTLKLQAGLCTRGDPSSAKDWAAKDTLISDTILVTRNLK